MKDKTKEISEWLGKADHDLGTAIITYLNMPEYKDTITFHCQQSVEKCLKAYLIYLDVEFKFIHDLIYLLELINPKDNSIYGFFNKLFELSNYAVEVRYPNELVSLTNEKIIEAIETAKQIRKVITEKMNIKVDYDKIIDTILKPGENK